MYNEIKDITAAPGMGMLRKTAAAAINVLKALGGSSYAIPCPNGIADIDGLIKKEIVDKLGYKPNISTSTLRRHGLLRMEIKDGIGYAAFASIQEGYKMANADRAAYETAR